MDHSTKTDTSEPCAVIRPCSLGRVLVAATSRGLCTVVLGDDDEALLRELHVRYPRARLLASDERLERLTAGVIAMVDAASDATELPLDLVGTDFQKNVWQTLRNVPAGTTVTYSELARRAGVPGAARAVGTACGDNPVAIVVPCHRVVRSDGGLGGYRWGLPRKRILLERERAPFIEDLFTRAPSPSA